MMPAATTDTGAAFKALASLQARAALRGIVLHQLHDDRGRPEFVATLGAFTRSFNGVADVDAWLERIEGKAVVA